MSESECTITYSVLAPTSVVVNSLSITSCALIDSGLFVNEMSLLRTPLSRVLDTPIITTNRTPQMPMTLQGCRLLARANDSGLILIPATFLAHSPHPH